MRYPEHIGIIPDGNRTWARENNLSKQKGHLKGVKRAKQIAKYSLGETDIKALTFWGASTQNMDKRPVKEIKYLFKIVRQFGEDMKDDLDKNNINFNWAGKTDGLPDNLINFLENMEKDLDFENDRYFTLAFNYGGQDEIIRGIKKMAEDKLESNDEKDIKSISKQEFRKYLDFANIPELDLVIRTKGNLAQRTSGFMSWWIGYSELYFAEKKFPAFDVEEFKKALERFNSIKDERNFGK